MYYKIKKTALLLIMGGTINVVSAQVVPLGQIPVEANCDNALSTKVTVVNSRTGKIWMDRNLGASRAARSIGDYKSYGCLFQWGRSNDGHASIRWISDWEGEPVNGTTVKQASDKYKPESLFVLVSTVSLGNDWISPSKNDLWEGVKGINNPCPSEFRIPTLAEFNAEITQYEIINASTAKSSPLKFVLSGYRNNLDGNVINASFEAHLWTSTVGIDSRVSSVFIDRKQLISALSARSNGYSVRCIKN